MKLKVQSIHFDADQKLIAFIEERVDKLIRFYEDIIDGEVFMKLDKSQSQENKITEIKLNTKGKLLFAKEQSKSFEESTDTAVEALRKQIIKHKEKTRG
ncbi:MAG: ribosome-associated translation inhibitor RaiA [Bacteroidetes bacterium]|nr:ribosome-associated translation inhibitor RaiA [Bacteroidota bacterium]